jgi:TolB-like protein/DNA-binding winged helix-turn-helix (wHTH) protein/Tfp pilus assembly protein PilF
MSGTSSSQSTNGNPRFGVFEVDVAARELRKKGSRVKLQQQPFELLMILLEHPGQVVTREDLRQRLWPADVYVDFDRGLNKAMVKLREALGDSSDSPIYVETLPRVGYRFIGPIQNGGAQAGAVADDVAPRIAALASAEVAAAPEVSAFTTPFPATAPAPAATPTTARKFRWRLALSFFVVLLAALALGTIWARRHRAALVAPIRSIAVIPLDNLSGDPGQDYLAAGMTDELTTMLAKNSSLRVVSRTSVMQYKGVHRPLPEIAQALGVDGILEGSIERAGDKVHMTIQLIQSPSDSHVWAESYDRNVNDLVTLPSDAAKTIAKKLNAEVAKPAPAARYVNPEAHDAVMRGMYFWYASKYEEAGKHFQNATQIQPDYALAWAGLSMYYGASAVSGSKDPRDVFGLEEEAAKKAVELDDTLAEAHNALGGCYLFHDWNWDAALREFDRAIALDPKFAEPRYLRAMVFSTLNRFDEAIAAQKEADEADPFARPWALSYDYIMARRYDEAAAEARQKLAANPNDVGSQGALVLALQYLRKDAEWAAALAKMYEMNGDPPSAAAVRSAFQRGGFDAVSTWQLHVLEQKARTSYVSPVDLATLHAQLGHREEALALLEEGLQQRAPGLLWLQTYPQLDALHGDERYRAIVKRVGMPPAY